jgi:hypothetical protein
MSLNERMNLLETQDSSTRGSADRKVFTIKGKKRKCRHIHALNFGKIKLTKWEGLLD